MSTIAYSPVQTARENRPRVSETNRSGLPKCIGTLLLGYIPWAAEVTSTSRPIVTPLTPVFEFHPNQTVTMDHTPKDRRTFVKRIGSALAALGIGGGATAAAAGRSNSGKEVVGDIVTDQEIPLFSGAVKHGNLLFVAGKGAHFEGDIKAHTDHVLNELQKELERNGSSMERVLKVNVYLADLADYRAMNEVFRGRFGPNPPVRTTVACYGGIPGDSLVEMDCIAAVD